MRTMYRVEIGTCDIEGGNAKWEAKGLYNTAEEAENTVKGTTKNYMTTTGDYRVMECTMDEATFTMTEKEVIRFNYWKEIGRYENAEKVIKHLTEELENAKAKKPRTEAGEAAKVREVAKWEERINKYREKIARWRAE